MATCRVNWELFWSEESRKKQLPSLHGIVSRYTKEPDVIGMHGGLPPSNTFPFTWFHSGLLPLTDVSTDAGPAAKAAGLQDVLVMDDPKLVATAQQYNMHAQGYAPLVAWARDLVISLHQPATLQCSSSNRSDRHSPSNTTEPFLDHQHQQQQQQQEREDEPIGLDVVITPGASAALDSLVRVLVNPGDAVLVEEFTYAHMAEAHLLPLGCELVPVALDEGGLVPDHLDAVMTERQAAGKTLPRVLYTIPTGQNPTGSVMSSDRMQQVYALARKWNLVIIEDDAYYFLQYPQGPDNVPGLNLRPGFLSLDVDGRVARVDTLAKLMGPGFRLGWLSGPPALVAKVALYMAGISIGANMMSQVMVHELLAKSWGRSGFDAFVRRLQGQYARQAAVAAAAAQEQLGGLAEWQPARAGMFMWLKLAGDADSECLIEAAAASKVMVVPGHLISTSHLQAAHRKKLMPQQHQLQQQQQQQQTVAPESAQLLSTLQQLTQQLQQQLQIQNLQTNSAPPDSSSNTAVAEIAEQLSTISQQLQQHSSSSSESVVSASAGEQPSSCWQPLSAPAVIAPIATETPRACPFFRVSFVSVPPEAIREGFARLRSAILSCHAPKTPPGEESEVNSCSSSIGSIGSSSSFVDGGGNRAGAVAASGAAVC